ncbi:MAG: NAD(P)-dependent oxidoreductase, partial [Syntrophales bacterium]|nr:NAD(P)-dependent oxidoreductase [Syntrophales bacterium]
SGTQVGLPGGYGAEKDMKILLTGGSGFIGRNLVESLTGLYDVLAPPRQELDLMDDQAVRRYLQSHDIDVVIHCATKPGHRNAPDPTGLIYANTRMFFNLARDRAYFRKMILLTSGAVYDLRFCQPKMDEDYFDQHVPVDETGYSKYICSKFANAFVDFVELRPFGVFGKYEDWEIRFISNMICKALFDLPLTIKQNRRFDYVSVDDLIGVIRHFIENEALHRAYNVTPNNSMELKVLAEIVLDISGKDLEIRIENPEMGCEYSGSNERLRKEYPAIANVDIKGAVRRLYKWYADHREIIDPQKLLVNK